MTKKIDFSKTTKAHFEVFKTECERWLVFFGIKGWLVEYDHIDDCENRAQIGWRSSGRIACIQLSKKWENDRTTPVTVEDVKRSAFHEVCELLLSRISMMANGIMSNHKFAVEEETHNIIRTLENTVFNESLHKL